MYLDEKRKKTHVVRVRFDDYQYEQLVNQAQITGEQMAVLVRELVSNAINDNSFEQLLKKNKND